MVSLYHFVKPSRISLGDKTSLGVTKKLARLFFYFSKYDLQGASPWHCLNIMLKIVKIW